MQEFINKLRNLGYELHQIEDGGVGWGHLIAIAPSEKYLNFEIKERYLNEWSSDHDIRRFRRVSKRIAKLIEEVC